ncbi:recombinase family protein [Novosphingobium flavum]|uniref:recombinase family protein n=1 Tax=Novosphingobium flavum TaxID=1778672 RepID=UPI001C8C6703
MTLAKTRFRCAIYTRKSTEEGLDQQFNTLDAQRAACEAYILSQAGEGWECLPEFYDDGGWSGGNMDRPALKRLLDDMSRGRIDIVVVYKVDRLTRSLMDFARIVETFDSNNASFVSVTQAFNTTNSMGRLTLNVLLSFAQFEREVTGERIRDKIAASRARGIFMGGNVPLGYDLGDRKLVINETEAETVRHIFARYLELGSIVALAQELDREGIRSKRSTARNGNVRGGLRFTCGAISHVLRNRVYLGEAVHKGAAHKGEHEAIIPKKLFAAVEAKLAGNRHRQVTRKTRAAGCPLTGKLFDADGHPMRPSFGHGRGRKIYRYYVSETLLPNGRIGNSDNMGGQRLSAERVERLILDRLACLLPAGTVPQDLFGMIERVDCRGEELRIAIEAAALAADNRCDDMLAGRAQQIDPAACIVGNQLRLSLDARATRRGRTIHARVHLLDDAEKRQALADLVRASHRKLAELGASPLDPEHHHEMTPPVNEWSRLRIPVGFLAPDIQKALLQGTARAGLDPDLLLSRDLPLEWEAQRRFLGMRGQ